MMLSLGITAFASGDSNNSPIKKTVQLHSGATGTYKFYRVLDATIAGTKADKNGKLPVLYEINTDFEEFFSSGAGSTYLVSSVPKDYEEDAVSIKVYDDVNGEKLARAAYLLVSEENVETFAEHLRKYVDSKTITAKVTLGKDKTQEDLNIGYYYVRSDVGNAITLLTNSQNEGNYIVKDKNPIPSVTKQVAVRDENNKDNIKLDYKDAVHVEAGEILRFKIVVDNVMSGAENFVIFDKFSSAEFSHTGSCNESLYYIDDAGVEHKMTSRFEDEESYDYSFGTKSGVGKEWTIAKNFDYTKAKAFVVYFDLKHKAPAPKEGYINEAYATYGTGRHETNHDYAKIYGSAIRILKYANGDYGNRLAGVKFILMKKIGGAEHYAKLVEDSYSGKIITWVTEQSDATEFVTSNSNTKTNGIRDYGKVEISGLRYGETYYLIETETNPGFNLLAAPYEVKLDENRLSKDQLSNPEYYCQDGGVTAPEEIENLSGVLMPETGGIGTNLFYVLGSVMAVGAFVLLVTNKRVRK